MNVRTICTCEAINPTLDPHRMTFTLTREQGSEYTTEDVPAVELKLTAATTVVVPLCRIAGQYLVEIKITQIS